MAAINAAPSSFFSHFVLLSLISTAFTSMHGLNHDPLILQQVVSSNDHDDLLMMTAEHQFSAFKKEYGKTYPTQEEDDYRFGMFISNLRQARRNQIQDPTAIHGVTKFSDLSSSEFRNQCLLLDQNIQLPKNLKKAPILPTEDLPETYDWREYDAVTEVKDQVVSCDGHDDDLLMTAEHQFSAFKRKYGKTYPTQEEDGYRFGIFMSNLRQARRNQIQDPTAIHGVTKFSDLTPSEFHSQYLRLDQYKHLPNNLTKVAPILPTANLPTTFDWRDDDAVTDVKDQGLCGACWAFSSIAALETANFLATDKLVVLSEQQLVDCSKECTEDKKICNNGCTNGSHILAYSYMKNAGGIEQAIDYPYTATDTGSCKFDKSKIVAKLFDYILITPDEDQYAANLVEYGVVAVGINGKMMQTYTGGVTCPPCSGDYTNLTHAVAMVGYGSQSSSECHWIIKNSWGKNYGENGYYKLCKGRLTCAKDPLAIIPIADE